MDSARQRSLEDMLRSADPWSSIDDLANDWSDDLVRACEERFDSANGEGRKRLVSLLGRARTQSAIAVLHRRLVAAADDEAAQILRVLNGERAVVSTEQIARLFADARTEAVVAAGISGDASLVPRVVAALDVPGTTRHAALALAMLGRTELSAEIAARIATADGLDATGLIVALEVMDDPSVVPMLVDLLSRAEGANAWDLHHALWRLTGREPLVRIGRDRDDAARAYADAWSSFDLRASARPRVGDVAPDPQRSAARFTVLDGCGVLRIDYDPPTPGSSWPRWGKSLFVGTERLYEIGSDCGTCETTLRLTGSCPASAATMADDVRSALAEVTTVSEELLDALRPYLTTLRTGHYLARLVDVDLERVERPEASWLTRRAENRKSDDPFLADPADVSWPGAEHFQVRDAAVGEVPTYGVVVPQAPLRSLRPETVAEWEARIASGAQPTALALCWVEQKDVVGELTERFLVGVVLDGHHRLLAYTRLRRPARILAICRLEDSWGPPEDRSRWLHEALSALAAKEGAGPR